MPILSIASQQKTYQVVLGMDFLTICRLYPSIPIQFGCCQGHCGTCAIKIMDGEQNLSKKTKQEIKTLYLKQLDASYRLACQCALLGEVKIR
jgi:ferredoxin